ncbi:type III PLP-dependent enzyme [Dactylosporangium sucinum]|uniref:ornithine decarboxylase n=1 Tax=Dactylosporangium sucinum TaxID=1424081 RepID=A0A917U7G4_9ACTN|nr:type III PLP-dependent enzyme [Dactylosporangium sucinum]GGM57880.1 ornithine decarboxylase [Dactylosporangium sucinum]
MDRHLRTPELLIDLDVVSRSYEALTSQLPGLTVHYAMKCNPHQEIIGRLHSLGCRFEIASAAELDELRRIGADPAQVLYSNPVKPVAHIAAAHAAGVWRFAFDGEEELDKIAAVAPGAAVLVRLSAHQIRSGVPSEGKFGVDADTAAALLLAARDRGLRPYGVAFHVGSQMLLAHAWRAPLRAVARVMDKLAAESVFLQMVNLGGGFPARYCAVNLPPLSDYATAIGIGLAGLPYPVETVIEPGRAVVAEAGTLRATVIGTAVRHGRRWAHLDVGAFNGLMESLETGNELRFPVTDSRCDARRDRFHLTGPTCDSQDTIMFDVELSAGLRAGDEVYLGCAGAYTTVYASRFNGFDPPAVRCVSGVTLETSGDAAYSR